MKHSSSDRPVAHWSCWFWAFWSIMSVFNPLWLGVSTLSFCGNLKSHLSDDAQKPSFTETSPSKSHWSLSFHLRRAFIFVIRAVRARGAFITVIGAWGARGAVVVLDRGESELIVIATLLGDTIKIAVIVRKKLRHGRLYLLVLGVGELLVTTEDPDTWVTRVSIAIVVDRIGVVVSVNDSVDCHSRTSISHGDGRIDSVALALCAAVSIQVSDLIILGDTGLHVHLSDLHVEVVVLMRVEIRAHTSLSHGRIRGWALRLHVPHAHVASKVEIHEGRVVANICLLERKQAHGERLLNLRI